MAKNIQHIIHLHGSGSTTVDGKVVVSLPSSSQLEEGEIAINYLAGHERIATKDSEGNVITFPNNEDVTSIRTDLTSAAKVTAAALNDLNSRVQVVEESGYEDFFDGAAYDSNTKKIIFSHDGTTKAEIDASAFIKDGMVNTVEVTEIQGVKNLVITFNTDAGKENINIPVSSIFDSSLYYTKTETDNLLSAKANASNVYTKTETNNLLAAKADASDVYTKTQDDQKLGQGATYTPNTGTTYISAATSFNDADVKLDAAIADLTNEVLDNETVVAASLVDLDSRIREVSADTEVVTAITQSNIDTWNTVTGKTDNTSFTAHTSDTTVHVTAAERTAWNAKADASNVYTKTEADNLLAAKANAADVYAKTEVYTKEEINTIIEEDEYTVATSLNDLNTRVAQLEAQLASLLANQQA